MGNLSDVPHRGLTTGEIAPARSIFGDTIKYSDVNIVASPVVPGQSSGVLMTPFGNIHASSMADSLYSSDYSLERPELKELFIHEMYHVWEYRYLGKDVYREGAILHVGAKFTGVNPYKLPALDLNTDFWSLNMEQRAVVVQKLFFLKNANLAGSPDAARQLGILEAIVPREIQLRTMELNQKYPARAPNDQCFLADTPVTLADGTTRPIESIQPGDEVLAFDPASQNGLGATVPRKVTRLFRNVTNHIIDLRGVRMTPGHRVLSDNGDWLTIAAVLKDDRCVVEERDGGPVPVRARTGQVAGSASDIPVTVLFRDPGTGRPRHARVRAGIPAIGHIQGDRQELWTLDRVLAHQGYTLSPDGIITDRQGRRYNATPWPGSTPFEIDLCLDWIMAVDGAAYTPPWIADLPLTDEEAAAINASGHGRKVHRPAGAPTLNRHERRKQAALHVVR